MSRARDRRVTALLVVAALLVIGASASRHHRAPAATRPASAATTTVPRPAGASRPLRAEGPLSSLVLTVDGADRYDVHAVGTALRFDAPPTNRDSNLRFLVWDPSTPATRDQLACSTWSSQTNDLVQEGFGLRIRRDGDRWRTVTVTKNTLMAMFAQLNVHNWDSARPTTIDNIASVKVPGLLARWILVRHLPWRVCARAVGDHVDVKAWPARDPEPAWGDPRFGGTVVLPPGWDYEGRAGWYAGHLPPGGHAGTEDASVRPIGPSR